MYPCLYIILFNADLLYVYASGSATVLKNAKCLNDLDVFNIDDHNLLRM